MSTPHPATGNSVSDSKIEAFRAAFPDIDELSNDTLRLVLLQGKLDTFLIAVQRTGRRGTDRQKRVVNALAREIVAVQERLLIAAHQPVVVQAGGLGSRSGIE